MSRISLGAVLVSASLLTASFTGLATADPAPIDDTTGVVEPAPEESTTAEPNAPEAAAPAEVIESIPAGSDAKAAPASGMSLTEAEVIVADAPWNDLYVHAATMEGTSFETITDNTNAAVEKYEKTVFDEASSFRSFNTVWIKWKAPASGAVTIDTFGSSVSDTGLAVFTGSKMSTAKRIAVNDDSANGETRSRITSLAVKSGSWYYFQVGSAGQTETQISTGLIALNLSGNYNAPSNDNQGSAKSMTGSKWSASGSTIGSTIETQWEPTSALVSGGQKRVNSVWFTWTAPAAGTIDLDSNGSGARPVYINTYSSNAAQNIGVIPGGSGVSTAGGVAAINDMAVLAGTTYFFQVGDLSTASGAAKLNFMATYTGPSISKLSVTSGKVKGGNIVTITGSRLTDVTDVKFGGNSVLSLKHVGSTKLVVKVAPGYAKGKVAVIAYNGSIRSAVVSASHYTFK